MPLSGCRYEEEINRRTGAENEFVLLKKVRGRGTGGCLIPRVVPGSLGPLYPYTPGLGLWSRPAFD